MDFYQMHETRADPRPDPNAPQDLTLSFLGEDGIERSDDEYGQK